MSKASTLLRLTACASPSPGPAAYRVSAVSGRGTGSDHIANG
jgi:hypothetical protein